MSVSARLGGAPLREAVGQGPRFLGVDLSADVRDPISESELGDAQYYRMPAKRVDIIRDAIRADRRQVMVRCVRGDVADLPSNSVQASMFHYRFRSSREIRAGRGSDSRTSRTASSGQVS